MLDVLQRKIMIHNFATHIRNTRAKTINFMGIISCLLTIPAWSNSIITEIAPQNMDEHGWAVKATERGLWTVFTFVVPHDASDERSKAGLSIERGERIVSQAKLLPIATREGIATFQFSVSNDVLADSRFWTGELLKDYPAGYFYWANLRKFAEMRK